jgi:hypothetical protein
MKITEHKQKNDLKNYLFQKVSCKHTKQYESTNSNNTILIEKFKHKIFLIFSMIII